MSSRTHRDHHARLQQLSPCLQALNLRHTRGCAAGQWHLHRASPPHQRHQLAVLKVQHRAWHTRAKHATSAQRPVALRLLYVCAKAGVHMLIMARPATRLAVRHCLLRELGGVKVAPKVLGCSLPAVLVLLSHRGCTAMLSQVEHKLASAGCTRAPDSIAARSA